MTLDRWLHIATSGLVEEAQRRVEAEVRAHVAALMETEGLSEEEAMQTLGNAKTAARLNKRLYLTKDSEKGLRYLMSRRLWHSLGFVLLVAGIVFLLDERMAIGDGGEATYFSVVFGLLSVISFSIPEIMRFVAAHWGTSGVRFLYAQGIWLAILCALGIVTTSLPIISDFIASVDERLRFLGVIFCVVGAANIVYESTTSSSNIRRLTPDTLQRILRELDP